VRKGNSPSFAKQALCGEGYNLGINKGQNVVGICWSYRDISWANKVIQTYVGRCNLESI
jgi:hypothetical protein